ncbi:unnamed protein product [Candida verbasci]|uniref:Uncharacterized protein n=1 Tax=Candida verbasci TaxID=1227364 RepID=A0A9W4U1I8_9ASCO|nr:unnamed protein product [Candida verbasci]
MFKNLFKSNTISGKSIIKTSNLVIYHNSNSLLSHNLLNKLNSFNEKNCRFKLIDKANQSITESDFNFIINETLMIHPDNKSIILQLIHENNNKIKLLKSFDLHDTIHNYQNFKNLIPNLLIIDYGNKLIANDQVSIDRIVSNYTSCGLQNLSNNASAGNINKDIKNVLHPNIAEYCELY